MARVSKPREKERSSRAICPPTRRRIVHAIGVWKSFIAGRANVLAILKSRIFLGLIGLALLAVLLWFAGPYFAFADHKPLAGGGGGVVALLVLVAFWGVVMTVWQP